MGKLFDRFRSKDRIWWLAVAGWAVAVALAVAWGVGLVPYSTVWGDVGTWIAAVGTFGGLMYAGLGLRHQVAQRKIEETRRQAEENEARLANARKVAVSSKAIHYDLLVDHPYSEGTLENVWRVEFTLVNSSPYPVDTVVVRTPQFGESGGFNGRHEQIIEGTLLPGAQVSGFGITTSKTPPVFAQMVDVCQVQFTDTWGNHWLRGPQTLEPCDVPPRTC